MRVFTHVEVNIPYLRIITKFIFKTLELLCVRKLLGVLSVARVPTYVPN